MKTLMIIVLWILVGAGVAISGPMNSSSPKGYPDQPRAAADEANKTSMTDIHDIKPILDMGGDWWWLAYLATVIVAILVLLALARWWWKRRTTPTADLPAAPPVPPDAEAMNALDALEREKDLAPKQFYYRLSAILRRYVERRYQFPAAEMTTEELLPRMDQLTLNASLTHELKAFCREADPIKFARAATSRPRLDQNMLFVRKFIRQTTDPEPDSGI